MKLMKSKKDMKFKESTRVTKTQQNAAQRKKNFVCFSKKEKHHQQNA
jgi:hypothetical protein